MAGAALPLRELPINGDYPSFRIILRMMALQSSDPPEKYERGAKILR
jgi:hypothetical protein